MKEREKKISHRHIDGGDQYVHFHNSNVNTNSSVWPVGVNPSKTQLSDETHSLPGPRSESSLFKGDPVLETGFLSIS